MFSRRLATAITSVNVRTYATKGPKVAVLGAAGGIGQPLSMLLKMSPNVGQLALYDIVNSPGVAADLSHMSTAAQVSGHVGDSELGAALSGANVVVVPAGVPRKPGMTRDDLFNTNATIVHKLAKAVAKYCPTASVLVISNPVNSTVPIVAETLKREGNVFDKRRLFGVTTLDVVRARTFVGQLKGLDPSKLDIPVVGGHSGITILPLLSRIKGVTFTQQEIEQLTHRIQFGGDEVVQAKAGAGSATLSMAYAGALFTDSLLRGLAGQAVTECTYVQQDDGTYFSCPTQIGKNGVEKINRDLGKLSAFETKVLGDMQGELHKNIDKGVQFVASQY